MATQHRALLVPKKAGPILQTHVGLQRPSPHTHARSSLCKTLLTASVPCRKWPATHFTTAPQPPTCNAHQGNNVSAAQVGRTEQAVVSKKQGQRLTKFEKFCSAYMFVLPLAEGLFRMYLMLMDLARRRALDIFMNCELQKHCLASQVTSGLPASQAQAVLSELSQYEAMLALSSQVYTQLVKASQGLTNLMTPAPMSLPWGPRVISSVDATFTFTWLVVMVSGVVLGQRAYKDAKERGRPWSMFRRPELLIASALCGLTLRLGLAPMASSCEVALVAQLYSHASVALTLASTFMAAAGLVKVLLVSPEHLRSNLSEMMQGVTTLAHFNRNLLLFNFLFTLTGGGDVDAKSAAGLTFLCYCLGLDYLKHQMGVLKQSAKIA